MAGEIQLNSTTFATESGGTVTVSNVDSATNRQNLGLEIGVDVQSYDADTTKNDVANTFTANQIISVTDNTNAALRVTQLGTGNALVVEDETNPDSTPFVVDSSGKVLVGVSTEPSGGFGSYCFGAQNSANNAAFKTTASANAGASILSIRDTDGIQISFHQGGSLVGNISTNGSNTAFNTSSDYRLKENITEITDGITRVKQLNPSRFNFIADPENTVDGFIAHEVQDIVPEAVSGEKDAVDSDGKPEYQGVDYGRITPLLTAALKEAIGKIEMLEARIAVLEAK